MISKSDTNSDLDLVRRAVDGDEDALAELLLLHSPNLSRYVAGKFPADVLGVVSPDDVVQQTFVKRGVASAILILTVRLAFRRGRR